VVLARSAISLTEETGTATSDCEGVVLCGFAGLAKETLPAATSVDFIILRAIEGGDLVPPEFIVILFRFLNLLFVQFEPPSGSGFAAQGIRGRDCPYPRQSVAW